MSVNGNSTFVKSETFDDGSWDECGAVTTCAVRMSDLNVFRQLTEDTVVNNIKHVLRSNFKVPCPNEDLKGTILDDGQEYLTEDDLCIPYVRFCCADIGSKIDVVFKAIDAGDNSSICMVNVEVQGAKPVLTCPSDILIDCNAYVPGMNTGDVIVSGDCTDLGTMIESVNTSSLNQCGLGFMLKTFSVENSTGVLASCVQGIEIKNQMPIDADIDWPADVLDLPGICSEDDLSPVALGSSPSELSFDACSQLAWDYIDVVSHSGSCLSIERTWTVIDWCSRTESGSFKRYDSIQRITTLGVDAITVVPTSPSLFQTASLECSDSITVSAMATSGCVENIHWTFSLVRLGVGGDLDQVVAIGNEPSYKGLLSIADYRINWTANDGCNEPGLVTQEFTVQSTKAPSPICKSVYRDTLNAGETATVIPTDINVASNHRCHLTSELILSFSKDATVNSMDFTCGMTQPLSLWVMLDPADPDSLKANCTTMVAIECVSPVQGNLVTVSGAIYTEDYQNIEKVSVDMGLVQGQQLTDNDGLYAFDPMPTGQSYKLTPTENFDYKTGVSTLDLIMIQRHILGIETLDSPYKVIAADVDASNNLDGIDLIELRKLILGIYDELPNNSSWRFFDESRKFADHLKPWTSGLYESYLIPTLISDMSIDFIGVKIGDVNNDAVTYQSSDEQLQSRSQRWPMILTIENKILIEGKTTLVNISAKNYENISGWQGTLEYDKDKISIIDIIPQRLNVKNQNFNLSNLGTVAMSYGDVQVRDVGDGEILFQVKVKVLENVTTKNLFSLSSEITRSEAYRGFSEEVPLLIEVDQALETNIISANPNPFICLLYTSPSPRDRG